MSSEFCTFPNNGSDYRALENAVKLDFIVRMRKKIVLFPWLFNVQSSLQHDLYIYRLFELI